MSHRALDERSLARAVSALTRRDPDLAAVVRQFGRPPLWAREPGFATLVHLVLEQQVSIASARAAFERLRAAVPAVEAQHLLTLSDAALRTIGFSRQKTTYCRALAHCILRADLDLNSLAALDDDAVRAALTQVKGIGNWTADVYLLMAMGRPDAFPSGDLALLVAAQQVKRLRNRPTPARLERLAESWRPYRAVAARVLWHYYLSTPARVRRTARPTERR